MDAQGIRLRRQDSRMVWLRDETGGLMVWACLLMAPLLGLVGVGVDTSRGYMVRSRLSQALDAATLAAGRFSTDQAKALSTALTVFKANFPPGFMEATVSGPTLTFTANGGTVTVSGSASAQMPTYFVQLVGFDSFTVNSSAEVARKTILMDVVISIDVSGSMDDSIKGVPKIDAARAAARTLIDSMFGTSETKALLKVGLVTWNSNARILDIGQAYDPSGTTSTTVTTYTNPYRKADGTLYGSPYPTTTTLSTVYFAAGSPVPLMTLPPATWKGCVMARYTPDSTDNDGDVALGAGAINGAEWMAWQPAPSTYQCPPHGIQRLTNVKATIKGAIDLVVNPANNTNLVMGLAWGWRVLGTSGGPFAGDGTPPPANGEGELVRALVLMTDGANTQHSYDAYDGSRSASQLNSRTQTVAAKIKAAGVAVYAIQFGFNDTQQETLMKQVASGPSAPYYQYAPDAAALQKAFEEIGNHLSKLRLAK